MSRITETEGDLFDAPENTALIHACNCQGSWGKGIAETFRAKYPAAYRIYRSHCQRYLVDGKKLSENSKDTPGRALRYPEGTALLIPPQPDDYIPQNGPDSAVTPSTQGKKGGGRATRRSLPKHRPAGKKHWIVCLFTSWHYSAKLKSSPDVILENTILALGDLKRQLEELQSSKRDGRESALDVSESEKEERRLVEAPTEIWSCRFNAGLFGVPWQKTKALMEESGCQVTVVRPVGEPL
uniref:Uncharacterized protein n=1 Tax=Coccidioides posadasii RMSCC 3488 TaxID=454284 RepID=A0A0J6FTA8_COCPO|nr:hypothetical protein CPAG_08641 [Coccidioides posadasii RMSCC 3488]